MKLFKLFTVTALIVLLHQQLSGQSSMRFTEQTDKFILELKTFFGEVEQQARKKEGKDFMDSFELIYNSSSFSEEQQLMMIKTCNSMFKKKMQAFPYFIAYLKTVVSFTYSGQDETTFMDWQSSLNNLIDKSGSGKVLGYLETCDILFSSNLLAKSNITEWFSTSSNYKFETEANKPRIIFPELDLVCRSRDDSSVILNTSGVYYPLDNKFYGKTGKVTWVRAGFDENKVYAILPPTFEIDVRYSKFLIDSVTFIHKDYFNFPMQGRLDEKILANKDVESATYPRFSSYNKNITIRDIFPNIDYEGGFSLNGAKFVGIGDKLSDAVLYFKRDGKVFVRTGSKSYVVLADKISTQSASVTIYWQEDSIYHPGLQMTYIEKDKKLSLYRDNQGVAMSPFFNSFHKVDMFIEALEWQMNLPKIDLKMIEGAGGESEAMFESVNYFSRYRFDRIQGIDEQNPLIIIKKYMDQNLTNVIYVNLLSDFMRISPVYIKTMLLNLSNLGFVIYDIDEEMAIVTRRLNDYIDAFRGRRDYDVIQINSNTRRQNNATLSLINFDLKINGVNRIFLSDSQKVFIYPNNEQIILKKNRDFVFDGKIVAGMFDFYGTKCYFDYDKFKIELPVVDSLSFKVNKFGWTGTGDAPLMRIKSVIENMSGELLLDDSKNKSGLKTFNEYPVFNSKKNSFVYYDSKSIQNGVYKKDKFFYTVTPFSIDSLDNFKTEGLEFNGYLASAGIFPNINQPLRVMADYTLGFDYLTPSSGLTAYGGKGNFNTQITLSSSGLHGNGTLTYLTSSSKSEKLYFFPDSASGLLSQFKIEEADGNVQYPGVVAEKVNQKWLPYQDIMMVKTGKTPFVMFNTQSKLKGDLLLTPKLLSGKGFMEIAAAEMQSGNYKFRKSEFNADTCDFSLKSIKGEFDISSSGDKYDYQTFNFKGHVDFTKRRGDFTSNAGDSIVKFPINQYICYMNMFTWFIDKDETEFSSTNKENYTEISKLPIRELVDQKFKGSDFISLHPRQDSLRFTAQRAIYKRTNNEITAHDVVAIKVADALIKPGDGKVVIYKKAEMEELNSAKILANISTKYHELNNSKVKIFGRKNYSGSGVYDYKDETGKIQNINFSKITVDSLQRTIARGEIAESTGFKLSPDFDFKGDVNLLATNEYLTFDGGVRIKNDCDTIKNNWLLFVAEINPGAIAIPVLEEPKDFSGHDMYASVMLAQDAKELYSAFLTRSGKKSDYPLISSSGTLVYNKESKEYRISNPKKLIDIEYPGNYLSLDRTKCINYAEGKLKIGDNFGQVEVNVYGNMKYFIIPDSAQFDLMLTFNFLMSDEALKVMNQSIQSYFELAPTDLTRDTYIKALGEIFGVEKAQKYITEIKQNYGFKKLPPELTKTFVLTDVQMHWNSKTKSFVSIGKIGIGSIDKIQVNKYVDGIIEIERTKTGNEFTIYLEFNENDWYYFNYQKNGRMMTVAGKAEFNDKIREAKPDDRKIKTEPGQFPYQYFPITPTSRKSFLKKLKTE